MENQILKVSGRMLVSRRIMHLLLFLLIFQMSGKFVFGFYDTGIKPVINQKESALVREAGETKMQQPVIITGHVTDEMNVPLPGVNIVIKNKTIGTVTNIDGAYSIELGPNDQVLVFSYVGYLSQEIMIGENRQINVSLQNDFIGLEKVVVIGYGQINKASVTSSVTNIQSSDLIQGSVTNPLQLLKGKVAGLAINRTTGDPNNDNVQLMLRGVSTLSGSSQPLIVIDGIPAGNLSTISPDDIESIDVLKDGSAAAIYGTRGTNGVILITTKKGATRTGEPAVQYHGYFSVESIQNEIDVFTPDEYREIPDKTDGFFEIVDQEDNTNWWGIVSRKNPVSHTHNLSIKGGNSSSNYIAAVNYRSQEGLIINTGSQDIKFRLGLNHSAMNDKLRFSLNVNNTVRKGQDNDADQIYFNSLVCNPTESVKNETGAYTIFAGSTNPVPRAKEYTQDINWNTLLVNGKIVVTPIRGLNFSLISGLQRFSNINDAYGNRKYDITRTGTAWRNTSLNQSKTLDVLMDYNRVFSMHNFTVLGGYSYNDYMAEGFDLMNYNFPSDAFDYNSPGLGYALLEGNATMNGFKNMNKLIAFFGRINYNFDNKYMLTASVRREGSSKFGKNNKWGTFPAVSAGWRISQENFLSGLTFIDELKLRVGYGVTGTEPSSPYLSLMKYDYSNPTYYEGKWIFSVGPSENANPDLKWETKHETNIGLDFAFLKNRLGGSMDYYIRNTKDLLYTYNVPVPPNLVSTILANVGEVKNSGFEVTLNGLIIENQDFTWNTSVTFSRNRNELVKLSNEDYKRDFLETGWSGAPVQQPTHLVEEGQPLGNFYGWKSIGLDSLGAWVVDGEYGNLDDRQILGNGIPKTFAGLTSYFRYKGFDLTISLRGAFDFQILNQYRMLWENFIKGQQYNFPTSILDHPYGSTAWTKTEPAYVSYYLEDGDYVKIDNITLGYNLQFNPNNYVSSARIYISALNPYTFTKYKGIDPEVNILGLAPGFDELAKYPMIKTYSVGLKISF